MMRKIYSPLLRGLWRDERVSMRRDTFSEDTHSEDTLAEHSPRKVTDERESQSTPVKRVQIITDNVRTVFDA